MGNKAINPHPEKIERVIMLMNRENLSQTKLAKKMGISQQRVSEFLTSKKISSYYMDKIKAAFPEYISEWLDGYGDPEIATKEDLLRKKFDSYSPPATDLTDFFAALDSTDLFDQLKEKLDRIDSAPRGEILLLLNRIVEPYLNIPEWTREERYF